MFGISKSKLADAIKACEVKQLAGSADGVSEGLLKLLNLLKEDGNNLTLLLLDDEVVE